MTTNYNIHILSFKSWLKEFVFPIWSSKGVDPKDGGFFEALSFSGDVVVGPRRCLVQSRQIYSFLTGARMNVINQELADTIILRGADFMIKQFQQMDGSFVFSIDHEGNILGSHKPLYTQAFAIFGLAQAYSISSKKEFKEAAEKCVRYLSNYRKVKTAGFTEVNEKGDLSYASNPHMHLFEAVLAWAQIDEDPQWKRLCDEVANLALTHFICPETHVLGEYFDQEWNHLRQDGVFVYEPGHQYEWAWLFKLYDEQFSTNTFEVRHRLFSNAEQYGTERSRGLAVDEMWSNHKVKTSSARFWPQGERVKAACRLGIEAPNGLQTHYAEAADEALVALQKYLQTPQTGYWYDQLSSDNQFIGTSAKASSLYHIINAMEEYENFRPRIS